MDTAGRRKRRRKTTPLAQGGDGEEADSTATCSSDKSSNNKYLPSASLRHTDVICGRGRFSKHPGNLTFLSLVHQRKDAYHDAPDRKEKNRLAEEVKRCVEVGLDPPGRFVQQVAAAVTDENLRMDDGHTGAAAGSGAGGSSSSGGDNRSGTAKRKRGQGGAAGGEKDVGTEEEPKEEGGGGEEDDDDLEEETFYEIVDEPLVMEKIKQALRQKVSAWDQCLAWYIYKYIFIYIYIYIYIHPHIISSSRPLVINLDASAMLLRSNFYLESMAARGVDVRGGIQGQEVGRRRETCRR